jgi:hypothetical protein
MQNSVVIGTSAADEGGFAKIEYGRLKVENSVIYGADAAQGSMGLADDDGRLSFRNSVLLGASGGTVLDAELSGEVSVVYTDLFDNLGGFGGGVSDPVGTNGNLSVDPMFVSPTDLHLQSGSPLVDAGDPALLDPDGTVSDIGVYGGPRALP